MEQPPPYTPQDASDLSSQDYNMLGQPQAVKVFGILHLVFAGLGILGIISGLAIAVFGNPFLAFSPKTPALVAQAEQQAAMQAELLPVNVFSGIVTVVVATLMIIAGIRLLKKRKSGLAWSNRYAWASIAAKVINLVLGFAFTLPIMRESMSGLSTSPGSMAGTTDTIMIGSMVIGALVTAAYPVLALVLLNRPNVKAWFATRPD